MKRLFLFDFDGVVVDSLVTYEGTVKRCLEKIGQPLVRTRADFLELFDDNFYASLKKKGINLAAFMAAAVEILEQARDEEMKPFAGVLPVLEKLKRANTLIIISSSDTQDIRRIMERYHLTDLFQDVYGSDRAFSKIEKIHQAMQKYGVAGEDTYYVGDTAGDIKEAREAGIKTIAVTWGWHDRKKLLVLQPDYLIDRPSELLTIPRVEQ